MSLACLSKQPEYFAAKYLLAAVTPSNACIKLSEIWVYFFLECSHFYLFFYSFLGTHQFLRRIQLLQSLIHYHQHR